MSECVVRDVDFQRYFVKGTAPIRAYAQSIDSASQALLREAQAVTTVNDALRLYHIASGLRDRMEVLCGLALEQADALCEEPRVIARIDEQTPWGVEVQDDSL